MHLKEPLATISGTFLNVKFFDKSGQREISDQRRDFGTLFAAVLCLRIRFVINQAEHLG